MEDLPIERGICASRIRCYTEGAMQRPTNLRAGRSQRPGQGTLYKSTSSLTLAKNAAEEGRPPSSNQRELCKSCDQLEGAVISRPPHRTFVSSMNISLTKPEPPRKWSLPHASVFHHNGTSDFKRLSSTGLSYVDDSDSTSVLNAKDEQVSSDSFSRTVDCVKEKDAPSISLDTSRLPWEVNDEFPHIPVLERIREFERQTRTLNNRSSSPGRWKRRSKTNQKKSGGSVHSSPALSRRNSVDEKVVIRNSRNSSPAVFHLHTETLSLETDSKSRALGEVCESTTKPLPRSDLADLALKSVSVPPEIVLSEQEGMPKSEETETDSVSKIRDPETQGDVTESMPSDTMNTGSSTTESANSLSGNGESDRSTAVSAETHFVGEAYDKAQSDPCSEQLLENTSTKSTPDAPADQEETSSNHVSSCSDRTEHVCVATAKFEIPDAGCVTRARNSDTRSECVKPEMTFVEKASIQESTATDCARDHQENSISADVVSLKPLLEDSPDQKAEKRHDPHEGEAIEATDEATIACEQASGMPQNDSLEDCQPASNISVQPMDRTTRIVMDTVSENQSQSLEEDSLDTQCNRPNLPECVTRPTHHCQQEDSVEDPHPIQPSLDEILKAGNSVDTDVYSQRCSQQLGECRPELMALKSTSGSELVTELLHVSKDHSPCLSDCYSSNSSISDDESQTRGGLTHSDLNPNPTMTPSINLSQEYSMCSIRSHIPRLSDSSKEAHAEECLDLDLKPPLEETPEESSATDTDQYTDNSPSSTSDSELSDSVGYLREALESNQIPDLSSTLGACGGLPPSAEAPSNAVDYYSDKRAFSRHLSALLEQQQHRRGTSSERDAELNADQALFLSRVNMLLHWIRNQPSQPVPACIQAPVPSSIADKSPTEMPSDIQRVSCNVQETDQSSISPIQKENESAEIIRQPSSEPRETAELPTKPHKRSRRKKDIDPEKVGHLRYLILQSPLVLSDSDSDESDIELNELGEIKQDYPLGRLPDYIVAQIFGHLPTRDLAALKCACKDFKWLIEKFDIKGTDSRWSEDQQYMEDPCMQCGKIRDPRGDVSLCRWHPKIYYKNGEIGRHYWTCCFANEEDAPGCVISLHDNKWSGPHSRLCRVPRAWRQYWRSYPLDV